MERVQDVSKLVYTHVQGGQFRWVTVSTLMLALGTILHLVSPSVAGITPNWMIATYCVAIHLTRPNYRRLRGSHVQPFEIRSHDCTAGCIRILKYRCIGRDFRYRFVCSFSVTD